MTDYIITGCDLHDNSIVLKISRNSDEPESRSFRNTTSGRKGMIAELKKRAKDAGGARIVFAYEASSQGFGLCDELTDAGIDCRVLAPTRIPRSTRQKKSKDDDRDALQILEILRAHLLAGNEMPEVWLPDKQTRDDREVMRARLDAGEKTTAIKAQIQSLLKRNSIRKPEYVGGSWTVRHRAWLASLSRGESALPFGAGVALGSLLRQLDAMEEETRNLDIMVEHLSQQPRYKEASGKLMKEKGVGLITAMVFLTEMGDMSRFANRRRVAAFLGLVPACYESGETDDRKGHITHQGPFRMRKVLCQAVWARVRYDKKEKDVYERIVGRNPKHKKIAVVACMRRLSIRMWHIALGCKRLSAAGGQSEAA